MPFYKARIIGNIDIEAYTFEDWYVHGSSQVEKIEFHIDDVLKETKYSEPFT